MDNTLPTRTKDPLASKGHLSRTQLYILTATLSLCIIGLSGYLIWFTCRSNYTDNNHLSSQTDSNDEKTTSGPTNNNFDLLEFSVRLSPDSEPSIFLKAEVPKSATLEYSEGPGAQISTVIQFSDARLSFSIPHMALLETLSETSEVESEYLPGLYRISIDPASSTDYTFHFSYSNQVTIGTECSDPTGTYSAPCGLNTIALSADQSMYVLCESNSATSTSCDNLMKTLRSSTTPIDEGWVSYTDTDLLYSLEIPYTWTSVECTETPPCRVSFVGELFSEPKPNFTVYDRNNGEMTIFDYIASKELAGETATEFTIYGKPAWKIEPENPAAEGVTYLVVTRSASYLEFEGNPGSEGETVLPVFQQIVESLRVELNP